MQFHRAFYEKHGIKVTEEPIDGNKNPEQIRLENALHEAVINKSVTAQTVKIVEQAVEKYPNSEALKNYLYAAYIKTRQPNKAFACLINTVKKHPDYVFGLINLVNHYILEDDLNKASALLTEPYDVRRVEKEDFIHHSVFINYYQAVVRLAIAKNDMKTAEKYHRLMFDYDPKNATVKELRDEILDGRVAAMNARMSPADERAVEATPKAILGWEASDKAPVFTHPEVHQLYTIAADENMPQTLIKTLFALPRETFIKDLENVLADMIRRRDYYLSLTEWDENTMSFPLHAIYFLTELRAYDSLPAILNILRQDEEFLELWFSIELHDYFYPCIYLLGNAQLPLLQDFVLEPYNFNWARNIASDIVAQVALRQPERRSEALDWFKTVMQTHLNQPENNGIIDSTFIGSLVGDCVNCGMVQLEPEIIALYEKGWVEDMVSGDLEEIKASFRNPADYFGRYEPLPASIQEMYSNRYSDRMEDPKLDLNKVKEREKDPYEDFLSERVFQQMNAKKSSKYYDDDEDEEYYRPPQETVKRVEPKVGRNDPCPCGSGKKYKKCHGA